MTQNIPHSDPASVKANNIEIVYDTFGETSARPMLLIMGLACQMIVWDDEFCEQLAARGYWVIRFDNRDVGLSTKFDEAGIQDTIALMQAQMLGQAIQVPYTLRDMADDATGLLDALGIASAHVVGISMGGVIAQIIATHNPKYVRTLTSIMASTGNPGLPPPKPEAMVILTTPAPTDREGYVENYVRNWRVLNGPVAPFDEEVSRKRAERVFDRGLCPAGATRQLAAIIESGDRRGEIKSITVPTLVIHGDADPLVPVEGGIDAANTIPGAELLIIEGMGHSLPQVYWAQIVDAIARHAV